MIPCCASGGVAPKKRASLRGSASGDLAADRTNIGVRSLALLRSLLPREQEYLRLTLGGVTRSVAEPRAHPAPGSAGEVISQNRDLAHGSAGARVRVARAGMVLLQDVV
jgi:hypothetical protein